MDGLTVFTVNSDNPDMVIQDEEKAGGKVLGMMLPYFVTILLFAGAMGIGTDMVAGEKERGTMASLLVSPIKRSSIVLGKVFAPVSYTHLFICGDFGGPDFICPDPDRKCDRLCAWKGKSRFCFYFL